jgi:tetratricopeptide (TPR) repeat protein
MMSSISKPLVINIVVGFLFLFVVLSQNSFASSIQGIIYDKQLNPLSMIDVELLDDYYRVTPNGRTRTDGAGRYQFDGIGNGRYTVRVLAFRYDLQDEERPVEVNFQSIRGGEGNGMMMEDFYLRPKKGGIREAELSVVFVQEIPKEAKTAYEKAVEDFAKKKDAEGFTNLKKSIEIFPTYYAALHRYGLELFARKQYLESAMVLLEAAKVNEKNPTDFYYIGLAFYKLDKNYRKAAYSAVKQAFLLAPASDRVLLLMGQIERASGKFPEAEKHLLQAKKMSTLKNPDIHKELAMLYGNDLKRYKEAADELELYMKASKAAGEDEKKIKKQIADLRAKASNLTSE